MNKHFISLHKCSLSCLYVLALWTGPEFATDTHDQATLVDKVAGEIHDQQQDQTHYDDHPNSQPCAEARAILHVV